jgi:hypothetical protein
MVAIVVTGSFLRFGWNDTLRPAAPSLPAPPCRRQEPLPLFLRLELIVFAANALLHLKRVLDILR